MSVNCSWIIGLSSISFGHRNGCLEISDHELVLGIEMHCRNFLKLIVLKQRAILGFEFKEVLYLCKGLSSVLDVLLCKSTGSFVKKDCGVSVGLRLDLQN